MKEIKKFIRTLLIVITCALCVECYLDLPEGASCTSNGVRGTCVPMYTCRSAAWTTLYLQSGFEYEQLPELCSYDDYDEPIYCCTDCQLDRNQTLRGHIVTPGGTLEKRRDSISWNKCMGYFQELPYKCRGEGIRKTYLKYNEEDKCVNMITYQYSAGGVGGRDAKLWELPHMALLGYGSQGSTQWLCGGSVISERFILTAAHCSSAPKLGSITYAALGILKRSELNDNWNIYNVQRIIVHPQYKSPSKYHDIALLETNREINFGRGLLPACLDVGVRTDKYDPYLSAPGWGRLGHNKPLAETLQVLELQPFNTSHCEALFPPHRHLKRGYDPTTQMCYGAATHSAIIDTCEGDSGGPTHYEDYCMYVIIGVTSFGRECGTLGSAGMYTRVKYYVPWIESIVWPLESY